MKAIVRNWESSKSSDGTGNNFVMTADSIEIIEDEPAEKKREVRNWDVFQKDGKPCVFPPDDYEMDNVTTIIQLGYEYLFNLADLIAEMLKAEDGKTETMKQLGGCRQINAQRCGNADVFIELLSNVGSTLRNIIISKSDARCLGLQIFMLARED